MLSRAYLKLHIIILLAFFVGVTSMGIHMYARPTGNILKLESFEPEKRRLEGIGAWIEEQDERSVALSEVDLNKVALVSMLRPGEELSITGGENYQRVKDTGYIRLDARVLRAIWKHKDLIPESWKAVPCISFDGTLLGGKSGVSVIHTLSWSDNRWHHLCYLIDPEDKWHNNYGMVSAVLLNK